MMSPRPGARHQKWLYALRDQLAAQLPGCEVLAEVDLDLQLAPPPQPGTVRVPDLVVVPQAAFDRIDADGTLLTDLDALLG